MDWRAADKVATWKLFKRRMKVIFMADQVPEERQYALILVPGRDEAYNRWDTLEETVEDPTQVDQVWDAFEKSFEQSTSFWHFRDAYLTDFRQDPTESMADLDLHIKQTVRGCQWKKEVEEEQMIDLLYHATIYYEIRKYIQESEPAILKYEMVIEKRQRLMRETASNTKTIKLPTEEQTVRLCTITPCYLLMPLINVSPVAGMLATSVANVVDLMSEATVSLMGNSVTNVRVLIISKQCVIQMLQQPRWHRAPTGRSHSSSPGRCQQAAMAKEEASSFSRRRRQRSIHHRSRKQKGYIQAKDGPKRSDTWQGMW